MSDLYLSLNAILCTFAFAGLVWRLVGRWTISFLLGRLVVGLLAALEFIVALSIARRAALGGPFNEAQYAVTVHAVAVLAVVVLWPRLMRGVEVLPKTPSRKEPNR